MAYEVAAAVANTRNSLMYCLSGWRALRAPAFELVFKRMMRLLCSTWPIVMHVACSIIQISPNVFACLSCHLPKTNWHDAQAQCAIQCIHNHKCSNDTPTQS